MFGDGRGHVFQVEQLAILTVELDISSALLTADEIFAVR